MISDYFFCALRSIFRHKLRSFLTVFGIIVGISSVICVVTIGFGSKDEILSQFDRFGIDGILIYASSNTEDNAVITQETIDEIEYKVRDVNAIMPLSFTTAYAESGGNIENCLVWGAYDNYSELINLSLSYGRKINSLDVNKSSLVCMIDAALAKKIFGRVNVVGKNINVEVLGNYSDYQIVGVVDSGGSGFSSMVNSYVPGFIYVPFTTFTQTTGITSIERLAISFKEDKDTEKCAKSVMSVLNSSTKSFRYENMLKYRDQIDSIMDIVTLLISAVASISLIVGGVGIMTIMLVSINERKREIGIKKALGAKKRTIMKEILCESVIITVIGGAIGIGVGCALSYIVSLLFKINIEFNGLLILFTLFFCAIIGIIFSIYPARKAANLDPIIALRDE